HVLEREGGRLGPVPRHEPGRLGARVRHRDDERTRDDEGRTTLRGWGPAASAPPHAIECYTPIGRVVIVYLNMSESRPSCRPQAFSSWDYIRNVTLPSFAFGSFTSCAAL